MENKLDHEKRAIRWWGGFMSLAQLRVSGRFKGNTKRSANVRKPGGKALGGGSRKGSGKSKKEGQCCESAIDYDGVREDRK